MFGLSISHQSWDFLFGKEGLTANENLKKSHAYLLDTNYSKHNNLHDDATEAKNSKQKLITNKLTNNLN